jgi:ubiquinone/menaquinone biosynthesis C-methylase UbiE
MKKIETINDFYDRFTYLSQHHGGPCSGQCAIFSTGKLVAHIHQFYPDLKLFLDVGAGTGGWADTLRKIGKEVVELDHHPRDNTVVKGDMHFIPLDNGIFDAVFASHVFEHSIAPLMFLVEANRVLKPNGFIFMAIPNPVNPWVNEFDHTSVLNKAQVENLLIKSGFELKTFMQKSENEEDFKTLEEYRDPTTVMQIFIAQKVREL